MTDAAAPHDLRISSSELRPTSLSVGGYKHATVGLIALAIAVARPVILSNVPDIEDVRVLNQIIREGGGLATLEQGVLTLDTRSYKPYDIPATISKRAHGVLYLMPVLLGRFGRIHLGQSGGCALDGSGTGAQRPVHHMISVLERFGATLRYQDCTIEGEANKFSACDIDCMFYSERSDVLTGPLVSGATKTAILAAACTHAGETRIRNYYPKPDVTELLCFLEKAGFCVRFEGKDLVLSRSSVLLISYDAPIHHQVVSCLSEVMTYIALAQHCGIAVTLTGLTGERLRKGLVAELALLNTMEIQLDWQNNDLIIKPAMQLRSCDIEVTSVGIYSDHQPFFALMLLRGHRAARIREHVWKKRFSYVRELGRLGAQIAEGEANIIVTPSALTEGGQTVVAEDLRAAAVLVLAALTVPGWTRVRNAHHLVRGYPDLVSVLRSMGAQIESLPPLGEIQVAEVFV